MRVFRVALGAAVAQALVVQKKPTEPAAPVKAAVAEKKVEKVESKKVEKVEEKSSTKSDVKTKKAEEKPASPVKEAPKPAVVKAEEKPASPVKEAPKPAVVKAEEKPASPVKEAPKPAVVEKKVEETKVAKVEEAKVEKVEPKAEKVASEKKEETPVSSAESSQKSQKTTAVTAAVKFPVLANKMVELMHFSTGSSQDPVDPAAVDKEGYEADWGTEFRDEPYPDSSKGLQHHPDNYDPKKFKKVGGVAWPILAGIFLLVVLAAVGVFRYMKK